MSDAYIFEPPHVSYKSHQAKQLKQTQQLGKLEDFKPSWCFGKCLTSRCTVDSVEYIIEWKR